MSTSSSVLNPAAVATATRVRWKIFLLMLMLISINYIDRASLSVAMPLIGKEFDLDPAMQGLILSAFFWTYAFMQVPGGMLADRYKPRIVIALSTVGWGFFQTIAAIATMVTAKAKNTQPTVSICSLRSGLLVSYKFGIEGLQPRLLKRASERRNSSGS